MTRQFPDLDDVDGELGILIRGDYAAIRASGKYIDLMHEYPNFSPSQEESTPEELVGHMSMDEVGLTGWDD